MRKICFRGKDFAGVWWYGFLSSHEGYPIIHPMKCIDASILVEDGTIGQFTGRHDKNGKEIYDGDILLWTRKNVHIEGRPVQDLLYKCVVYYDDDKCAFQFRCELSCGACVGLLDFDDDRADESFVEVIGNVFDNSSLIEKGDNNGSKN